MNKAETKALVRLLRRLDVILLIEHKEDVMAVQLIGRPEDVTALSSFIIHNKRPAHTIPKR